MKKFFIFILISIGLTVYAGRIFLVVLTPQESSPVAAVYPEDGLYLLDGVDYSGFSAYDISVTNSVSPSTSYEVAEWTRIAGSGDPVIIAGGAW